jgi:hypothetical protein
MPDEQTMKDHIEDLLQERAALLEQRNKAINSQNEWKTHSLAIMEELTAIETDRDIWKAKAESLAIRLRSMETDLKRLETEVGHG